MADAPSKKRKGDDCRDGPKDKRAKGKKGWVVPHRPTEADEGYQKFARQPEPGDSGIWVTCDMKKEGKSISELRPLFEEHAGRIYHLDEKHVTEKKPGDVAKDIADELKELRDSERKLFTNIKIDTQCLIFFKTSPPIEPVNFVLTYCQQAQSQPDRKQTRTVRKLTPITLAGKASEKGLEEVAQKVLAPHFHGKAATEKKFAIRVNLRNHSTLKRDDIIKQVAAVVGPGHRVDLKNYDLLILIEIYQTSLGMSVVGSAYEKLKRFNLAEIYAPDPPPTPSDQDRQNDTLATDSRQI